MIGKKKTRELSVEEWKTEIDQGLKYRATYGMESKWAELEALFYNVHKSMAHEGPNLTFSTGDALMSALTVPRVRMLVSPRLGSAVEGARILEGVDDVLRRDMAVEDEMETAVLHAFLWGRGILKVGYDSEWGWDEELEYVHRELGSMGLSLTQFDSLGRRIEFDSSISPGMPWVRAVLPHDIVVPWGTYGLSSTPWIAHRVLRHVDAIKADPKYPHTKGLEPTVSMEDFVRSYTTVQKPYRVGESMNMRQGSGEGKVEFCELYEIHDRRTGTVKAIANGHKVFLRESKELIPGRHGFVEVGFIPKTRTFWTTPDSFYIYNHQAELSDISIQATKQRRISVLRFLYLAGAMDEGELEKVLSSDVGIAAAINEGTVDDVRKAITTLTPANNNMLLYQDAEYVKRNARDMTGLSRNQMGEFEHTGRRTATEVGVVQEGSDLRMGRKKKKLTRSFVEVFDIVNEIIFRKWNMPKWVEVMGVDGERAWREFTGMGLRGKYLYDVEYSEEGMESRETRQAKALELYAGLAGDPLVNQVALRDFLVRESGNPSFAEVFKRLPQGGVKEGKPVRDQKGVSNAALRV